MKDLSIFRLVYDIHLKNAEPSLFLNSDFIPLNRFFNKKFLNLCVHSPYYFLLKSEFSISRNCLVNRDKLHKGMNKYD